MRRIWFVLVVIAIALALAIPAVAGKPDKPGKPEPPGENLVDTTCAAQVDVWDAVGYVAEGATSFTVSLVGKDVTACWDVMSGEGSWQIAVNVNQGTLRSLLVVPRDSIGPGDSCGGVSLRGNPIPSQTLTLPFADDIPRNTDGDIEAAYVNACGTDFDEVIDGEERFDIGAIFNQEGEVIAITDPDPLAVQIMMQGSKDADVDLVFTIPPFISIP